MDGKSGGNILLNEDLILDKAQIFEKMLVANLGCGVSGHFVYPVAERVGKKKGKVYAVDILRTVLERVARRAKQDNYTNIETVWSNLELFGATKIDEGSLDVALLINVLYQSHRRAEILREAIRLLKKDGRLVVVEWKNTATPLGPPVEERVKKELLEEAGKKLGLRAEEDFEAGPYHYGILFVK